MLKPPPQKVTLLVVTTASFFLAGLLLLLRLPLTKQPVTSSTPKIIKINLNPDNQPVGFVRAEIAFNPNQTKITSEITTSPIFKNVISKTSMLEANQTGRIVLVLGLVPEDKSTAPLSPLNLA